MPVKSNSRAIGLRDNQLSRLLLSWYDVHAREMPWRVGPQLRLAGLTPDPYQVWLSEIMLQQTTVASVRAYYLRFIARWPTVGDLADAEDRDVMAEWAGLGYYARARNLLKCARVVQREMAGVFPDSYRALLDLPGIGPYTAAAVAAIAYDHPETVVDGNVERVMARYFAVLDTIDIAKPVLVEHARRLTPTHRAGDYAQAVMDLGATVCTPKSPSCGACPWRAGCRAYTQDLVAELPRRKTKTVKPTRYGVAYLAYRSDGAWLLERRADKGLLGGMLGWPGAAWGDEAVEQPPIAADWADPEVEVKHTFTHFHLRLALRVGKVSQGIEPEIGAFLTPNQFQRTDLPTVMRKAYDIASSHAKTHDM